MVNRMKKITLRQPTVKDFALTLFISACGIAIPSVDGGLFNIANYSILFYGWLFGTLLFFGMFMKHLDELPDIKPWHKLVTSVPRVAAILSLAYAGFFWHASLLVSCWLFGAVIYRKTKTAYEEQSA